MIRWWSHLKLKVLAFGIAMSVLPLAFFGWYSLGAVRTAQLETVAAQNEAGARVVAEELAQFVRHLQSQLQGLTRALGPALTQMDRTEQERVLYTLLRDAPYLEEISLMDGQGREQLRLSRRAVTAGTEPVSLAGTPLWGELSRGEAALGEVRLDEDGRPLVQVGVPLSGSAGALVGQATLRGLMANIAAVRGNGDLRIHVLDSASRLIGDSDFSLVLAGAKVGPPADRLTPYQSVTGEQALGVAVTVPGLGWRVVGETTLETATAPIRRLGWDFAGGATALMILVVALSVVFGLQLTEPLERLEAGARRVGSGDLASRIAGGGRDELGRLIAAFNAMTSRLQAQSAMEAVVRQTEKLAAVGQLAAGVAHEINNPLAVIQAYAEDLDDRLKEEGATALEAQGELSAYLQQLQVQVRRCKGITTNLLDFARRGPAEPEPVAMADVVRATAALLGARARKAAVPIQCDLPEGLPPVRATRDELQQVFLNLLTNALDAIEETGPGTITVTGAVTGPTTMQVTVADTGPGMDAATLARAMEPFFTTKPPGRGTGLGLSTCYGILTGLGGQMSLSSQPGAGTTVSLQLPLWGENGAELVAADRG